MSQTIVFEAQDQLYQLIYDIAYDEILDKYVITAEVWAYNYNEGKFSEYLGELEIKVDSNLCDDLNEVFTMALTSLANDI